MTDTVLDVRGLSCPLPILRARKVLRTAAGGSVLTVLATDPTSVRDFQIFCEQTGHRLIEWSEDAEGVFHYRIAKPVDPRDQLA
jgi:tRNA 2-thiouridine synthesizing protein A